MKAIVAEGAGFCFGVKRALKIAFDAARKGDGSVVTLGAIIHNPQVVARLEEEGLRVVKNLDEVDGGTLVVRSHGLPRRVLEEAETKGMTVVDATCPFVKQAQERAAQLEDEGHAVVVVGEEDHPEVLSITGSLKGRAKVVNGTAELPELPPAKSYGVVCQTTQPQEHLSSVVQDLLSKTRELKVFNTICEATRERQQEACALAGEVDRMVVVGGRNSANTRRLAELCASIQPRTLQVETSGEIEAGWLRGARRIGVTAGASTPDRVIQEVVRRLEALRADI